MSEKHVREGHPVRVRLRRPWRTDDEALIDAARRLTFGTDHAELVGQISREDWLPMAEDA